MPASAMPMDDKPAKGAVQGSTLSSPPANHRVVSVSPRAAQPQHSPSRQSNRSETPIRDAMESLRSLLEHSRASASQLNKVFATVQEGEKAATQAAVHLQERLQLSAQMLKAFQSQISRIDNSIAELKAQERRAEAAESRLLERLNEVQARIDAALQQFAAKIEQASHAALEQFDSQCAQRAAAHRPAEPAPLSPQVSSNLSALATTMHEIASRIAAVVGQAPEMAMKSADQSSSCPSIELEPKAAEMGPIHVVPPLRFHTWAAGG